MLCFGKVPLVKKFIDKRSGGRGVSRFYVEKFLSHRAEKLRLRNLQCFTNFGYRKILCFSGFCQDFLPNNFV